MIDSAKLYVKAGIDLKMVNLGLAWYGRSYKLLESDCAGYGCDMTGGGAQGKCTGESEFWRRRVVWSGGLTVFCRWRPRWL